MFLIIVYRGLGGVREFGPAAPINSFLFSYVYHNSNAMYVKYSHESVFWELPHVKPSYSCAHDLSVPFLLFTSSGTQIALYSQEV